MLVETRGWTQSTYEEIDPEVKEVGRVKAWTAGEPFRAECHPSVGLVKPTEVPRRQYRERLALRRSQRC